MHWLAYYKYIVLKLFETDTPHSQSVCISISKVSQRPNASLPLAGSVHSPVCNTLNAYNVPAHITEINRYSCLQ
jgi:hypothetical protein